MPKYDTLIKYINNGSVISESKLTIPLEEITQEKINIGMELILRIHNQEPVNAHVKIMRGKRTLKKFEYKPEEDYDDLDEHARDGRDAEA